MNPKQYKYSREHEWICPESADKGKMGLTDYAQSRLGDIVFLELPDIGTWVEQFAKIGEIESVKAVSDLFTPVGGKVTEINQAAIDDPSLVNRDPYRDGWLVRLELSKTSELDALMNGDEYDRFVTGYLDNAQNR
jgi:glycine cleavage system H protein